MTIANFNAGPAALPRAVMERAQAEFLDFQGSGMSIMEQSHRGKLFDAVHNEAISLLRELVGISPDYDVLFLQGGASHQFAMVPLNLLHEGQSADYINTGHWSERAIEEAEIVGKVHIAGSSKQGKQFPKIPTQSELSLDPNAAYVHITTNNTIEGTQFHYVPETNGVPLIADMSSDFIWKPFDASKYAMIYAGAQKNIGPSGIAVVIIRKDLVAREPKNIPKILRYKTFSDNNSLFNTPPTFSIYMIWHVLKWTKEIGGLVQIEAWNQEKAKLLYGVIDANSTYYRCPVAHDSRSTMNVVFRLPSEALEDKFCKEADKAGLMGLKGHRSVGGIRASLYNAIRVEDTARLCGFMEDFAKANP